MSQAPFNQVSQTAQLGSAETVGQRFKATRLYLQDAWGITVPQSSFWAAIWPNADTAAPEATVKRYESGQTIPTLDQVELWRQPLGVFIGNRLYEDCKRELIAYACDNCEKPIPYNEWKVQNKKAPATSKSETGKQPEHSHAESSPPSQTHPSRGATAPYDDALSKMAELIAAIDHDRARESLSTGNSSVALCRAYQRLGALLQETRFMPTDLNFIRLFLHQANDWRERSRLLDQDSRVAIFAIDGEFRADLERFGAQQRDNDRILEHDPTPLKIVRNQYGSLWLILTDEEFFSRFPHQNAALLLQEGS